MSSWKRQAKLFIKRTLQNWDIEVMRHRHVRQLVMESGQKQFDIAFLSTLPDDQVAYFLKTLLKQSRSQLRQDLFVLSELKLKRDGYFVEFGGTNGFDLSNTHLLENNFGWNGVVAEPASVWHEALRANRSCSIDTRCVWSSSDATLKFRETDWAELSTIDRYTSSDQHNRTKSRTYEVKTISLVDLLAAHRAPSEIDYMSIDTEGSEFEILAAFDFDKYRFGVITCEHNFGAGRDPIHRLLSSHGYVRVRENVSEFDDWYVGR